ncbi:tRNA pseudouridine(55) synthase TruB [Rhodopirellula baltica]|uniref:tRNA pseudouridine synthase B n=1 Tax=Rhodopirellula baltica WH47 TaxID=991778 RepID=F2AVM3_RHOBT|nr:tRNA pseudouridine(55) synthase TruB [Rhodopirellula baltica]EGF26222.1 tRNA pseudouridine synthase B [Rhodopirellula baltica WH47]
MDPNGEHSPLGFLPCYKPPGATSRDLVNRAQRRLRGEFGLRKLKVGHTGTLDPLAEGLVLLAIGSAARLTPWVLQHGKRYLADFRMGVSSESGDLESELVTQTDVKLPTAAEIEQVLEDFHGVVEQTPPAHSAIKVDGERAHKRARRGEDFEMPKRRILIDSVKLISYEPPMMRLDVRCGSGTYLRTLGMDVAAACGCAAVMTKLIRNEVGRFTLDDTLDCAFMFDDDDREKMSPEPMLKYLRPAIEGLTHMPAMNLDRQQIGMLQAGIRISGTPEAPSEPLPEAWIGCIDQVDTFDRNTDVLDCIGVDRSDGSSGPWGELVAILRPHGKLWHPLRVFPTTESITLRG